MRLTDRSRITTDWTCQRKRWWEYEYKNIGIVSNGLQLELFLGICVHDALAAIAHQHQVIAGCGQTVDIDKIATTAKQQVLDALLDQTNGEVDEVGFAHEQGALVEGIIRGFFKHTWLRLLNAYPTIIAIEPEVIYDIDSLITFMARPDLILADSEEGWHYIEYKTTSSKTEAWVNSWSTAVQLQSSIKAVEQTLHMAPMDVSVIGLYKGYQSYGKQSSPFCYAYRRGGNPPFSQDMTQYEYKAGFKRSPTWEMEGGVKAWVEGMPEDILSNQFLQTPPIFIKDELIERFFKQVAWREHEIDLACSMLEDADEETTKNILDVTFPQTFSECCPAYGHGCGFKRICHGHVTEPLNEGWQPRDANHQLEKDKFSDYDLSHGDPLPMSKGGFVFQTEPTKESNDK